MVIPLMVTLAVGLIGLSLLAMTWLVDLPVQWSHLSDMGQAYGGTSAVLSGLALASVSASLLMQSSLNRISQLHSIRQRQFDIVKLALDNPRYLYVDGSAAISDPGNHLKVYANLFVSHWAMVWDLAEMREDTLHVVASRLFESAVAREWWKVNGDPLPIPPQPTSSSGSRSRTLVIGVAAGIGIGILLPSATRRRRVMCLVGSRS
ncbi:DUF6082 family protein [Micromonospora sp. NPDC047793]|uniref:DUF6082 family protein n=1 Tax=Micromonospora sp. NPDC047793 TaxID=3154342 RepID=UPI0033D8E1FC